MVEFVVFKPEHLAALRLQAEQVSAQGLMTVAHGEQIAAQKGVAYTAMVDGQPIACAGLIELWAGRAYAWAYLSEAGQRHIRAIHRRILTMLAEARWRRVEMAVDVAHAAGKRWAWHLGFEFEGIARKWTTDGRDVEIWARVS